MNGLSWSKQGIQFIWSLQDKQTERMKTWLISDCVGMNSCMALDCERIKCPEFQWHSQLLVVQVILLVGSCPGWPRRWQLNECWWHDIWFAMSRGLKPWPWRERVPKERKNWKSLKQKELAGLIACSFTLRMLVDLAYDWNAPWWFWKLSYHKTPRWLPHSSEPRPVAFFSSPKSCRKECSL